MHAPSDVPLKAPSLSAFLAWLWPGAGHVYQGRRGKGMLFMVCILSIYVFGCLLGEGRVVYAAYNQSHKRWAMLGQFGVGLPYVWAVAQAVSKQQSDAPLFGVSWMYPPETIGEEQKDELSDWHYDLHGYFEMGTLYTVVAGLLNLLVVWDAFAGPAFPVPEHRATEDPDQPAADPDGGT